ncbi:MAG: ubiquitin-like domain-containing protein [Propionibacteriaceae bacterium]
MRKIIPVVAAGATALALAGGSLGYAAINKDVTLSVDGATTQVSTMSSTVGDVLEKQGIALNEHDVVAPATNAKVTDGTRIAVQYGRQVKVKVDGQEKAFWTTATRVDQALAALSLNTTGAAMSTSRSSSIGREGLSLNVATLKTVTVDVAGKKKEFKTTGQTVGDVLKAAKITVDDDDKLSVKPTAKLLSGASFVYTKVDVKKITKKTDIDFKTVEKRTSKLDKGDTRVDTSGRDGVRTLTYEQVKENGKVVSKKKIDSEVTKKARTKVVLVGTKVTVKKEESSSSSKSSSNAPSVASGGVWDRLAQCESGGNWSINTGNGFYGGLQFTKSTWRAYGGSGSPQNASRNEQIRVAKKVQAGQGWGAWPGCTAKLGIR